MYDAEDVICRVKNIRRQECLQKFRTAGELKVHMRKIHSLPISYKKNQPRSLPEKLN